MADQPRSREKRVTDNSKGVHRRGEGLGTGPVGTGHGPQAGGSGRSGGGRAGGGRSPISLLAVLAVLLLGGGGGLGALMGGDGGSATPSVPSGYQQQTQQPQQTQQTQYPTGNAQVSMGSNPLYSMLVNGQGTSTATSQWSKEEATGQLDTSVAKGSRAKYTKIKGNGKDTTTIMVYMCGTDLESRSGMATNDLKEMAAAKYGDNINIIVYTGGCKAWKINGISNSVNQIYQVKNGQLIQLEDNMGNKVMTDPATLTEFIKYCKKNFPADRNDLILWDHGGGSITGYGYDEKNASKGSMNLSGINKALYDAKVKFDFIGYDACLMATAENALMLNNYADYLIASEETEPGIGWYYTDWLNEYGKNPSMDTLTIGKNIVDGFINECNNKCRGQLTTLSVIDLAEFANTVPDKLNAFASEATQLIKDKKYQEIAAARQSTREFAQSTRIDQCDLVDLANRLGTDSAKELAKALRGAIKYNRTSSNMTNAYGVSIYFPNKKITSQQINNAVAINSAIGLDDEYSSCIKEYASLASAGQSVSYGNGNTGSPYGSLFDMLGSMGGMGGYTQGGQTSQGSSQQATISTEDMVAALLQGLLSSSSSNLFSGKAMSLEDTTVYLTENQFDASVLNWQRDAQGYACMPIEADQWKLVTGLEMNVFYDDGEGYVDLGCDNMFTITEDGVLYPENDHTWLAINGQPVAYYHMTTVEDGDSYTITGYVPAMVNDERVRLYLTFDQDQPYGYISGYAVDYHDGQTEAIAKTDNELQVGDKLDFLCDFYDYDGNYQDSYYLGEPMEVTEEMEISNVDVGDGDTLVTYKFTDIYGAEYWTPVCQ